MEHTDPAKLYRHPSLDYVMSLIWKTAIRYPIDKPIIFGNYVSRYLLRGEPIDCVDIGHSNHHGLYAAIKQADPQLNSKYVTGDLTSTGFGESPFTFDFVDMDAMAEMIDRNGLSPINSLVLTFGGIRHVTEVPGLQRHLEIPAKDPEKEREWAVTNVVQKRFCKWKGMRDVDLAYYKDWKVIDFQECSEHFIYRD